MLFRSDQHTYLAQRRIEHWVWVARRGCEVQALNAAPQVLLDVLASNLASVGDEVGNIQEVLGLLALIMEFDNGSGDDVNVAFLGKFDVLVEVGLPVAAGLLELWIVRDPVQEMIFG